MSVRNPTANQSFCVCPDKHIHDDDDPVITERTAIDWSYLPTNVIYLNYFAVAIFSLH